MHTEFMATGQMSIQAGEIMDRWHSSKLAITSVLLDQAKPLQWSLYFVEDWNYGKTIKQWKFDGKWVFPGLLESKLSPLILIRHNQHSNSSPKIKDSAIPRSLRREGHSKFCCSLPAFPSLPFIHCLDLAHRRPRMQQRCFYVTIRRKTHVQGTETPGRENRSWVHRILAWTSSRIINQILQNIIFGVSISIVSLEDLFALNSSCLSSWFIITRFSLNKEIVSSMSSLLFNKQGCKNHIEGTWKWLSSKWTHNVEMEKEGQKNMFSYFSHTGKYLDAIMHLFPLPRY